MKNGFRCGGRLHNGIDEFHDDEIVELKINPTIDPQRFSIQAANLGDGYV